MITDVMPAIRELYNIVSKIDINVMDNIDIHEPNNIDCKESGVYLLIDKHGAIVYVGESHDIKGRLNATHKVFNEHRYDIKNIITYLTSNRTDLERLLISAWKPRYNIRGGLIRYDDSKILEALKKANYKVIKAAKLIQMDPANLYKKVRRLQHEGILDSNYEPISLIESSEAV